MVVKAETVALRIVIVDSQMSWLQVPLSIDIMFHNQPRPFS